jgi:hypothetical protein
MGQPVEVRVLSRATLASIRWRLVNQLLRQKARTTGTAGHRSNRPIYLPAPFLLAAHRAFINWESRLRPAGVIPPFFTAGVAFVCPFILAQRALAAAASLARVAAGIERRPPLAVAELAREPPRIEERRFCRVSICRRIETASCKASIDISMPCHIAGVGCNAINFYDKPDIRSSPPGFHLLLPSN